MNREPVAVAIVEAPVEAGDDYVDPIDEGDLGNPLPPPTPHKRDGFFLSLQPALAYLYLSQRGADLKVTGFGFGFDFLIGGSLDEGLHLGAVLGGASFPTPDLKAQGATVANNTDLNSFHVGAAMDYYLDPEGGLHLLGELGYAQLSGSGSLVEPQTLQGVGLCAGLGYDAWVSDNWSLGALGRLTFSPLHHKQADTNHWLLLPTLNFTATYH